MRGNNVLNALMRGHGSVGDVDIGDVDIGDPTEMVEKLAAKLYTDRPFTHEDEVDVGGYDGVAIGPGLSRTLAIQVDNPFKPIAVVIPSWQSPGLQITQIQIAAVNLVEGQALPADLYTEVSTQNDVNFPTVQGSGRILVTFTNRTLLDITPNIAFKGKRIRGA